jgi:hypothetical protein
LTPLSLELETQGSALTSPNSLWPWMSHWCTSHRVAFSKCPPNSGGMSHCSLWVLPHLLYPHHLFPAFPGGLGSSEWTTSLEGLTVSRYLFTKGKCQEHKTQPDQWQMVSQRTGGSGLWQPLKSLPWAMEETEGLSPGRGCWEFSAHDPTHDPSFYHPNLGKAGPTGP